MLFYVTFALALVTEAKHNNNYNKRELICQIDVSNDNKNKNLYEVEAILFDGNSIFFFQTMQCLPFSHTIDISANRNSVLQSNLSQ